MLLFLSHLCGVRLMFSYSFFLLFLLFLCYLLFIFLVIQSDLEQTHKNFDGNFYCVHVFIVKDYGKLGILYDEKLGGFILDKKEGLLLP